MPPRAPFQSASTSATGAATRRRWWRDSWSPWKQTDPGFVSFEGDLAEALRNAWEASEGMGGALPFPPNITVTWNDGGSVLYGRIQDIRSGATALYSNAAIPAVDSRRKVLARMAGRRIVEMVHEDLKMSKVLTLDVDEASYWLYTNTPMDHARSEPDGTLPHRTSELGTRAALV